MGIEQISNSSLLSQLEQMNRQMNAMSQGAGVGAMARDGNPAFAFSAQGQAPYFDGASAARALSDNALSVNGALNPNAVESPLNAPLKPTTSAGQSVGEFKQLLKDAFENANILQNEAGSLSSRFDVGDRSVTLADVMIASQKSSLSFEATLQIRNKIVDAYQSIMQMQI